MEITAALVIGMLLGAAITLWTQWALGKAERPGDDEKQQISDSEYL